MKRFFGLAIVSLVVVFSIACGSGGFKGMPTSATTNKNLQSIHEGSGTIIAGNNLDVTGKECPSATSQLTSKNLVEAFVLVTCDTYAKGQLIIDRLPPSREAKIKFVSLTQESTDSDGSANLKYSLALIDCLRCPRDYTGGLHLKKNLADEWQQSGTIYARETEESYHVAVLRLISVGLSSDKAELEFEHGNAYFQIPIKIEVQGDQDKSLVECVLVQAQFEDGRVVEFFTNSGQDWSKFRSHDSMLMKTGSKVKILAYTFEVKGLGASNVPFKPEWTSVGDK